MLSAPVLSPALSSRAPSLLLQICSLLKPLGRDFRMNFLNNTTPALCLFRCKVWTISSFYCLLHACPWAQKIPYGGKPCPKQGQLEKLHCRAWCCVVENPARKTFPSYPANKGFFCIFCDHPDGVPADNTFFCALWSSWTLAPHMNVHI